MKNLFLLFIAYLFLQFNTYAQEGWFEQASGTTLNLKSVFFVNNNVGWAVGGEPDPYPGVGIVLKTTDGGMTWSEQPTSLSYVWYSVCFVDLTTGFLAGRQYSGGPPVGGTVAKTTDGGMTWTALIGGLPPPQLNSVCFTDLSNGWTVGDRVIKNTTNGGTEWTTQIIDLLYDFNSVHLIDSNSGWVAGENNVGDGIIRKTTNGGTDWTLYIEPNEGFRSVFFTDQNIGWVAGISHPAGNGTIYKTTDGGTTWIYKASNFDALFLIQFINQNIGWAVGSFETILKTTNGGDDWVSQRYNINSGDLRSVYFVDVNTGWVVGDGGAILKTITGGLESDTLNVPAEYSTIQSAINASNDGDIVLVADGLYYENINYKGKAITVASHFLIDGNETHIENTIIDGSQPTSSDTASVVVFLNGEDTTSVLCGFTITGGTGTYDSEFPTWNREGGGILLSAAGAKIINNIITGNSVVQTITGQYYVGCGGICASPSPSGKNLIIKDNIISNNYVEGEYYSYGAGIGLWPDGKSIISNNIISNNTAISPYVIGGGMYISIGAGVQPLIINNYISENTANSQGSITIGGGGGVYFEYSTAIIKNNLIVQNEGTEGGGIKFYGSSNPILENNTILNNTSNGFGGGVRNQNASVEIKNTIVWGNNGSGTEDQISGSMITVTYSDVEGGYSGAGNINEQPLFDMGSEFYLLSGGSPCIDAGNPDPQYNDVEDPQSFGNPLWPALGSLRNDMGHCGGSASLWGFWDWPIPVELTSFTGSISQKKVTLSWTTATETNNNGFEIERKQDNSGWEKIGFVEGHGTTTESQEYSFVDDIRNITATSIAYRLKQVDYDGSYEYSDVVYVDNSYPVDFVLHQNFPNPFNPTTTIKYSIPIKSQVDLVVYNALGEKIEQLVNGEREAGSYDLEFDASNLPSGIYFYWIQAGSFVETKKMVLLK